MASAKTEIETLTKQLEELTVQLDEKQAELAEVSKANEDEELHAETSARKDCRAAEIGHPLPV